MGGFAMTHAGYLAVGWTIPLVLLGAYAARLVRRGRDLSAQVSPEDRRWS